MDIDEIISSIKKHQIETKKYVNSSNDYKVFFELSKRLEEISLDIEKIFQASKIFLSIGGLEYIRDIFSQIEKNSKASELDMLINILNDKDMKEEYCKNYYNIPIKFQFIYNSIEENCNNLEIYSKYPIICMNLRNDYENLFSYWNENYNKIKLVCMNNNNYNKRERKILISSL